MPSAVSGLEIQPWPSMPNQPSTVDETVDAEELPPQHRDRDARAEQRRQVEHRAVERRGRGGRGRARPRARARAPSCSGTEMNTYWKVTPSDVCSRSSSSIRTKLSRPMKRGRAQQVVPGEREGERRHHRPDGDEREPDEPRQEEEEGRLVLLARLRRGGALDAPQFAEGAHRRPGRGRAPGRRVPGPVIGSTSSPVIVVVDLNLRKRYLRRWRRFYPTITGLTQPRCWRIHANGAKSRERAFCGKYIGELCILAR